METRRYRGQDVNEKWHYGYYFRIGDFHYIQTPIESISVNPFSVSQFTGIKDKDKNDIFELDVVKKISYPQKEIIVEFENGAYNISVYIFSKLKIIGNVIDSPKLRSVKN